MKGRRRERRETYFEIRNVVNADDDHHPSSASSAVLYILPFLSFSSYIFKSCRRSTWHNPDDQ